MFLIIVGTGKMGRITKECAENDGYFDRIQMVEPTENNWPQDKADLIIDFSHPESLKGIYEYCRKLGGSIPVVIGTTGHSTAEMEILKLLEKICPVVVKSNFSRGISAMNKLVENALELMPESDVAIEEIHHTMKMDSPSGTAKTLCDILDRPEKEVVSIRIGTVPGIHSVFFALEDEVVEIKHWALSKRIFAKGALEEGKILTKN